MFAPRGLVRLAAAAVLGALLGREAGILGVGAAGALALGGVRAGIPAAALALPAALGAVRPATDAPAQAPRQGESPRVVRIDGFVVGPVLPDHASGRVRFSLRPPGGGPTLRCRAALDRDNPPPHPGDRVRGPALLRGRGTAPIAELVLAGMAVRASWSPGTWPTRVRLACEASLARHVQDEAGRLAAHLVLGRGPRLAEDLVEAHRSTGLAHLLAVSGAHASMLALMLAAAYAAVRGRDPWLARGFRRTSAVLLLAYGAITGFEPPVLRALAAWCVIAFAGARGRRPTVTSTLAAPALLTALWAPEDLLSVSFVLSYAAVAGLALAGAMRRPEGPRDRVLLAARASLFAMAATTPFTLLWFGQLSPWTLVGTPLLAPLVTVMLALGVVTCALSFLAPALADGSGAALAFLTDGYAAAVRSFAQLPGAPIPALVVPAAASLAAAALAATALLCLRPTRGGFLAACLLASLPHFVPGAGGFPRPRVVLASVGHGQTAVAHLPLGRTAVIDCGCLTDPRRAVDAALRALAPLRRIDLLILSHGDADHVGGVLSLARRTVIERAVLPADMRGHAIARALAARGANLSFVEPGGQVLALDGAVHVVAPRLAEPTSSNDRSLWTTLSAHGLRIVLPGDADARSIRRAISDLAPGPVTALVLPHHGRGEREAIDALLTHLRPAVCLASSGDAPPVAERLGSSGTPMLSTHEHGDLTVHLDAPPSSLHGLIEASSPAQLRGQAAPATR